MCCVAKLSRNWSEYPGCPDHLPFTSNVPIVYCLHQAVLGSPSEQSARLKAIEMWWLDDIVIPALFILGIYCFVVCVGFRTRMLTRKTTRTAEDLYDRYADSPRKQQKYAKEHGGTWKADDGLDADVADIMHRRGTT
jgi:hypothetical protein